MTAAVDASPANGPDPDRVRQVKAAIETWSGQLVDLSGQNRLLYYRDLKVGTLDLADANELAVNSLLGGRAIALSELFPAETEADAEQRVFQERLRRVRAIRNKAVEAAEERGLITCFLATGMATWANTVGTSTPQAPVLLSEVTISAVGAAQDDFTLAVTGEPEVNPTLVHLLATQFEMNVDDGLIDVLDPAAFDPKPIFEHLTSTCERVAGFEITPRLVIGNFSYAKLPMVQDLEANLEALLAHDVVAAIAGNKQARQTLGSSGTEVSLSDPDRTPPKDEFLVKDADSSQSYAINAVVTGQNLVISGPPGTGKSQTIANLIATLVARGRSVLFVAEKRAAISAVLDRLGQVGLENLVLDLHSGVTSRRALAESLAAGLRAAGTTPRPDQSELHERVVVERNRLNTHDTAMHERRAPWNVSVFDAQSALLGLHDRHGPAADTIVRLHGRELTEMDESAFRRLQESLREFVALGGVALSPDESPWVSPEITSAERANAAYEAAQRLDRQTVPDMRRLVDDILRQTGLRPPDAVADWASMLTLLDGVADALGKLRPEVFAAPLAEMLSATAPRAWRKQNPTWPGANLGRGARRALVKQARSLWTDSSKPKKDQLHQVVADAHAVSRRWALRCIDRGVPRLPTGQSELGSAHGRLDQLTRELAALGAYLTSANFQTLSAEHLQTKLDKLVDDERTLRKMPRLNELRTQLEYAGLLPLVDEIRSRGLDATLAVAAYRTCWYRSILERIGFEDAAVANFDPILLDRHAAEFREADRDHIDSAAARVRRAAAEWLVAVRDECEDQSALVQAQATRKRGHLPARQLFAAAPDVMTALKPCWAMSPLMVSQLLPGDRPYFDVVVFDEASQIVPADAIPSILRAKRVVVAGDKRQLPPTSFFASTGDDSGDEPINDDGSINLALTSGYESILDVLTAALGEGRNRSLTWHYRSQDERLIAFSNAWMYDHSLTTFPGVAGGDCLSHVLVEQEHGVAGQEDSVAAEVERVVDLVLEHAAQRPDQSLGVITMGIKHSNRIDSLLRDRLRGRREFEEFFDEASPEKFFVKNLERVQGDERDAIILSIGYGKTADGRLPYRFGPLLQEGGDRRLNVAVTRARARMTLVSAFSHLDMDPNRSSAVGVKMLRAYLQYAASGGSNLGEVALERPALNPFEISVRDRLTAAGLPLTAQYGVAGYWIDFAVAHPLQPGRMVLAIEADGASYHSSQTARDRDRLRQQQLECLGWTFHRIWSTDWFTDTDGCVTRAVEAYYKAVAASDTQTVTAAHANSVSVPQPSGPATRPPRTPTQCPVPAGRPITGYSMPELIEVIDWIESDTLLRTQDDTLTEFLAALDFTRRGARIVAAFEKALRERARENRL